MPLDLDSDRGSDKTAFDPVAQQAKMLRGVENPKLKNIVQDLYKPTDRFIGGTPGADHLERLTGTLVGGRNHLEQKAPQYLAAVKNVLRDSGSLATCSRQMVT